MPVSACGPQTLQYPLLDTVKDSKLLLVTAIVMLASDSQSAKVGLCELKLDAIATDETGGMGGTCVLRGCIPKKFMVYAGEFTDACQDAEAYGYALPGLASFACVAGNERQSGVWCH